MYLQRLPSLGLANTTAENCFSFHLYFTFHLIKLFNLFEKIRKPIIEKVTLMQDAIYLEIVA